VVFLLMPQSFEATGDYNLVKSNSKRFIFELSESYPVSEQEVVLDIESMSPLSIPHNFFSFTYSAFTSLFLRKAKAEYLLDLPILSEELKEC
jgi:hypothetical protein